MIGSVVSALLLLAITMVIVRPGGEAPRPPRPKGPAGLTEPEGLALQADGGLLVADTGNDQVVRVDAGDRSVTRIAGTGEAAGAFVEGLPATATTIDQPAAVLALAAGGFLVGDKAGRLMSVSPQGDLRLVPKIGQLSASLGSVNAVVAASTGLLYLATDTRVLSLDPLTGILASVAGSDTPGYSGDGGDAVRAQLAKPIALAIDASDAMLYIADCDNGRIRQVDLATRRITTLAGRPNSPYVPGGLAAETDISCPRALAVTKNGDVYVSDGQLIARVAQERIEVVAGVIDQAADADMEDGRAATATRFLDIRALAVDAQGRIYLSEGNRVRRVEESGVVSTYA